MNKLYIIGNGFDRAHGLKTSYLDFLLWYINNAVHTLQHPIYDFNDELIILKKLNPHYIQSEFNSLQSFKETITSGGNLTIKFRSSLFENIYNQALNSWVDIEYEYYRELLKWYTQYNRVTNLMGRADNIIEELEVFNSQFGFIKIQLEKYLQTIIIDCYNNTIEKRFKDELNRTSYSEVLFLVFNYTNAIDLYTETLKKNNYQVINIHGKLGDEGNPIIFGYGDEMDEYYGKIESLNKNEFTRNIKSFWYFKNNNLRTLNRFIDDTDFTVTIMGHSCGISDRVLLNSIFCHQHCRGIRIYYFQKSEHENDFFEKTQEISRHFPRDSKNKMRRLIVPFSDSLSLT